MSSRTKGSNLFRLGIGAGRVAHLCFVLLCFVGCNPLRSSLPPPSPASTPQMPSVPTTPPPAPPISVRPTESAEVLAIRSLSQLYFGKASTDDKAVSLQVQFLRSGHSLAELAEMMRNVRELWIWETGAPPPNYAWVDTELTRLINGMAYEDLHAAIQTAVTVLNISSAIPVGQDRFVYDVQSKSVIQPDLQIASAKKVIFWGDSMTDYANLNHHFEVLFPQAAFANFGKAGDTAAQGWTNSTRISYYDNGRSINSADLIAEQPDVLFVKLGANDLTQLIYRDQYLVSLETLLTEMKKALPHTRIALQSLTPVNEALHVLAIASYGPSFVAINNAQIRRLNYQLRGLAMRLNLSFVYDAGAFLGAKSHPNGALLSPADGLHLTDPAGYSAWENGLRWALRIP